jgi:hypothetical protein
MTYVDKREDAHIKFSYDLKMVTNNKYLIECLSTQ